MHGCSFFFFLILMTGFLSFAVWGLFLVRGGSYLFTRNLTVSNVLNVVCMSSTMLLLFTYNIQSVF
ncbi:hypothetical protein BDV28DRAFT_132626 [Aspergillus coremiiformis]|uniref:Uncharacterized protein n=1 Tax=Aspergillus coremiiformis TaxID=138285 RepID=A0A5N6ZAI0_9EURO|nr:hypothetical protein BDV28DRAFT_132626 [Aspergillus coremiiformis]